MNEINATLKAPLLKMGSDPSLKVTYLPTTILPIDTLLQGGIPKGRFVTITGDFSTLKSYIGLRAIAATQSSGGVCALIDTEHSYDPEWAAALGVDTDELIVQHPETGELAIDAAEVLIRGNVDLIVFDSVAAQLPQAEQGKRLHDENVQPARIAQLMSQAMRKLTAANDNTAIIWINQMRMNIGVTFGSPEIATGGKALPYYSSYILSVKKVGKITRDVQTWDGEKMVNAKETVAQKFKATVEKSKLSKPFRDVYFQWSYEDAEIDEAGFLISLGLGQGLITQKGAAWTFDGQTYRGRERFRDAVATDETLNARMRELVLPKVSPSRGESAPAKKTAGRPRKPRSSEKEPEATPTPVRARSSSTAAKKTPSSRSRTRAKPSA